MKNKSNKTLLDFQDKWEKLVDKAMGDFASLTFNERIWFTIQALIGAVDNGGLVSHYYNSDATWNKETIEDLDFLGFINISNLLRKINLLFPNGNVPRDIDERNDLIANWDNYDELLAKMDAEFYNDEKRLEAKLIAHIEEKIIKR